ncbi:uncharacterized protein FFB20_15751 [Fusarium fujikuroi]|uniref:Uncharacterized protein n=2 Tax=Fusarium fujikuroi TaxID=5127 RepID=S0EI78_GIBF5|nr:uncharacterized protein FFUJ_13929 [Fusarium fujikuroi IMI 58289]KLO93660.1 uncharacterized protein Y057_12229 [Fusarium fujikuroi]QGI67722.1 hypothetical protein CEK27_011693 [Fusarium fujikuroi]QGI98607.1 hypothetical protein CEK26_011676 [Fusarium fujikuroi]CCT72073.1 uncharacterized protein FFUJ_13929 [Fusarium fujikuroi IMI 58289]SCO11024.1 uncharacterized protein FFC1_11333 [Fusarium fujikuroi]
MFGAYPKTYPDAAHRFQGEMDRSLQSAHYQNPIMRRVIFTLKESFPRVTENLSVSPANNPATFVRHELGLTSANAAIDISICPACGDLSLASRNTAIQPVVFVLGGHLPADQVIYPTKKSVEEQETLFAAERNDDEFELLAERLARFREAEFTPLNRTPEISGLEKRLDDNEKMALSTYRELKRETELMEQKLDSIHKMVKSPNRDNGKRELGCREGDAELASSELIARDVKTDGTLN